MKITKTYHIKFHTKNDYGDWMVAKSEESYKIITDRCLLDIRAEALELKEAIECQYPKGLTFTIEVFE